MTRFDDALDSAIYQSALVTFFNYISKDYSRENCVQCCLCGTPAASELLYTCSLTLRAFVDKQTSTHANRVDNTILSKGPGRTVRVTTVPFVRRATGSAEHIGRSENQSRYAAHSYATGPPQRRISRERKRRDGGGRLNSTNEFAYDASTVRFAR